MTTATREAPPTIIDSPYRVARRAAAAAAGDLAAACARETPPEELARICQEAIFAAGELRMLALNDLTD